MKIKKSRLRKIIKNNDYIITYNVSNSPIQKENIILLKEIGRLNIYKLR